MHLTARDGDLDQAGRGVLVADPVGEVALGVRGEVHAEHHGGLGVGERPLDEHLPGAAGLGDGRALLGGLEHEQHGAGQLFAHPGEHRGGAEQHRGVAVVPAGVRDRERAARVVLVDGRRGEVGAAQVGHRQRVGVGPQRDHPRAGPPAAQHPDDAVPGDAGAHLVQAEGGQVVGDQPGGRALPVGQFGVPVQVLAPRHHLRCHLGAPAVEFGVDRIAHGSLFLPSGRVERTTDPPDRRMIGPAWRAAGRVRSGFADGTGGERLPG